MNNNKYFLPLESTLYIRRGANKIKNTEYENWSHDFIIKTDKRNPNDVFIIPEEKIKNKIENQKEELDQSHPQKKNYPKIRIFIDTY